MSDQILVSVKGYYTLDFYTTKGDCVEAEEVTEAILPFLQNGTYMICMGSHQVLRIDGWQTMFTFEVAYADANYEFKSNN
jgi:hypothetical protein